MMLSGLLFNLIDYNNEFSNFYCEEYEDFNSFLYHKYLFSNEDIDTIKSNISAEENLYSLDISKII